MNNNLGVRGGKGVGGGQGTKLEKERRRLFAALGAQSVDQVASMEVIYRFPQSDDERLVNMESNISPDYFKNAQIVEGTISRQITLIHHKKRFTTPLPTLSFTLIAPVWRVIVLGCEAASFLNTKHDSQLTSHANILQQYEQLQGKCTIASTIATCHHPCASSEVSGEHPCASSEVSDEHPCASSEVSDEHPCASSEVSGELPCASIEVSGEHPCASSEVSDEHPCANSEVSDEHPCANSEDAA
uniref:(California timema) hypothetical protein n=1 Tax=Timema californicum TaxID=61474 RepID=A0A7R9PBI6_TIMCA|nr:unnamed protein product [Timema californicum]